MWWPKTRHQQAVEFKRHQRDERISELTEYLDPLTSEEAQIVAQDAAITSDLVRKHELKPRQVLTAFTKKALEVHKLTNCLTEICVRDAERWAEAADLTGPLAGIPVSLKDVVKIGGYDATTGYSARVNKPVVSDSPLVRLLKDAGAVPFVKTNVPITMMSTQSYNDLFGLTTNPHNSLYSPGGSSSGEGALIGGGGSRIGVGTDVGGSVRAPAHNCGIYSLRPTAQRFPFTDEMCVSDGFEGVPTVAGPMARSLKDLRFFLDGVMAMKPWRYDYHALPLPWRKDIDFGQRPKIGVQRWDRFLKVTPAVQRAIDTVVAALEAQGCEVVEFTPPQPGNVYLDAGLSLYLGDSYETLRRPLQWDETNDSTVGFFQRWTRLPRIVRYLCQWFVAHILRNPSWAAVLNQARPQSVAMYYDAVARREKLREEYWNTWNSSGISFLICPPHSAPALPVVWPRSSLTWGYTEPFNLLDMPAGIMPVTYVDKHRDALPASFDFSELNMGSLASFDVYDPVKMHGLPVGVQIVAKRYQDEEVLAAMELVENALISLRNSNE